MKRRLLFCLLLGGSQQACIRRARRLRATVPQVSSAAGSQDESVRLAGTRDDPRVRVHFSAGRIRGRSDRHRGQNVFMNQMRTQLRSVNKTLTERPVMVGSKKKGESSQICRSFSTRF